MIRLLIAAALAASPAAAQTPDARGKRLFLQCQACHSLKKDEPHKLGPNLAGVAGAKAASREGYVYSPALAKSGLTWDDATLDRWLERPSALVPGNKMVFAGLPRADDRRAVVAYLKSAR